MPLTLEFNSAAPEISIQRIRSDFEAIWRQNVVPVTRQRRGNSEAGDYFNEGEEEAITDTTIYLNIQGTSTEKYSREKAGISTTGALYHFYARHFEDLQNLDVIIWDGKYFIMKDVTKSFHNGQIGFIEGDLFLYDKV